MPLPPSRKDLTGPPPRNVTDLAKIVRHHDSYLRQLDAGMLGGTRATPKPLPQGPSQIVGSDGGGGEGDDLAFLNTDRANSAGSGDAHMWLTQLPIEGSEHVTWFPNDGGGIRLAAVDWARTDQLLTIPAFPGLAAGDVFTCEYAYIIGDDVPEPALVGVTLPGVWNSTAKTLTYALPTGTALGDALVLTVRGQVGPGGGEEIFDIACSDPRMTLAKRATIVNGSQTIVEAVWTGIETGFGGPIVVNVTQNPSYNAWGEGVLAAFTGINAFAASASIESGSTTPVVDGIVAVAVTWIRTLTFSTVNAAPPSGYTLAGSTGLDYSSTAISWWYDPDATTSPAGTFSGEGCFVIALT